MSFTDALSRISEIQQQIASLSDGTLLSGAATPSAGTSTSASTTSSGSDATAAQFADALADAQLSGSGAVASDTDSDPGSSTDTSSMLSSLLSLSGDTSASGTSATTSASGGASVSGGGSLPANASTELTSDQRQFASTLSADTGLNPGVVCAWLMSEENGSAAQSRQATNNNDWLNVGYTDTATIGADDSIWSNPITAANATAAWLKGQNSIPGYGTASSGVQSILDSVGQSPQAQISALQSSGWASGGYPDLGQVYSDMVGG